MTILYLYAELMGYQIPVFRELVENYQTEIHVVHWDKKKLTPYTPPESKNIAYYKRSEYNLSELEKLVNKIKPELVYVSGWMDSEYLKVCKKLRKNNIPVVAGSDTQYRGGLRQNIGRIYFKLFLKNHFSHIWVAGPYQYEYARKLGFSNKTILFSCLTADTNLFKYKPNLEKKRNFLFVGRFEKEKGIAILLKSWNNIQDKKGWTLTFVGNGSMKEELLQDKSVVVKNFMQPEKLVGEFEDSGCFILPSVYEPWALVIHEAVSAGLPIIATNVCGASPVFITSNYNGYICQPNHIVDLQRKIEKIMNLNERELALFSQRSHEKSKVITPELVAASFISAISDKL
jgi:glycosyltransferase involved in cell wall biosynthesis